MAELAFELVPAPSITCEGRPQAAKRDPHCLLIDAVRVGDGVSAAPGHGRVGRLVW
jgi:hypothetical protein